MDVKELMIKAEKNRDSRCKVTSEQSRDNNCYLVYEYDANDIYRLNSTYRPIDEAKKWASQYKITKKLSVIYMFGLGNGYFARELKKNLLPESRLIIIEPSYDIFYHVMESYDLSDIFSDKRVELFLGRDGESSFFYSLENFVHWTNLISQMICIHPVYDKIFNENMIRYETMIRQNNEKEIRNRNTEAHFGKRRVENVIMNLRNVKDSNVLADIAERIPKDIPAIIVAAGPSLDKNIDILNKAKGRAFIIGCDTALRHLHKHGIMPDIAITVDANKPERYFDEAGFEETPVFTTGSANYKAILKGNGRKIWFSGHAYQIELYKKLGKSLSYRTGGGSVATAAFAVCSSLGFKKIILVGQDLAYSGEASHAGGEHSRIRKEEEGITYVQGIDGEQVRTRSDWVSFLQWFKNAIKNCEGETEVIDATEGGALIEGAKLMALADVIEKYCAKEFDFNKMLNSIKPFSKDMEHMISRHLEQSVEDVKILEDLLTRSIKLADECLLNFNQSKIITKEIEEKNKELSLISRDIQQMPVYLLIDEYARNETMEYVQELFNTTDDEKENSMNYYRSTKSIYEELLIAMKQVLSLFDATIEE